MAAAMLASPGTGVLVLDQNDRPGAKLSLTGGGRCNILPAAADPSVYVTSSSRNSLAKILRGWSPGEARSFFAREAGVGIGPEAATGKLFAVPGGAPAVTGALEGIARRAGAVFRYRSRVSAISPSERGWTVSLECGESVESGRVVLATGGRSWPGTGSGGWGFAEAARLGHTVRPVYPALVPLLSGDPGFGSLSGIVVEATISSVFEGRPFSVRGPLLFTHRGFSGPVVMDASHAATGPRTAALSVSWGGLDRKAWEEALLAGRGLVRKALESHLPSRLAGLIVERAGLDPSIRFADLTRDGRMSLLAVLSACPLPVSGNCGWDEAEVTGGGVALEEVDPASLESRLHPGLHFAGEVLDAFGPVGGCNLYWAWLTGRLSAGARRPRKPSP